MQGVLEVKKVGASSQLAPDRKMSRKDRRSIVAPTNQPSKKRLTDEQSYLAAEYWDWAMKVAQRQAVKYRSYGSFEHIDWEGAAAIGVCEAAYAFEIDRGLKFETFAYPRVVGATLDMMRGEAIRGYRRGRYAQAPEIWSFSRIVASDHGRKLLTLGMILSSDDAPVGCQLAASEDFEQAIRCLSEIQREILRGYYRRDRTMRQLGESLGLSESRVSQLHSCAMDLLRKSSLPREALAS